MPGLLYILDNAVLRICFLFVHQEGSFNIAFFFFTIITRQTGTFDPGNNVAFSSPNETEFSVFELCIFSVFRKDTPFSDYLIFTIRSEAACSTCQLGLEEIGVLSGPWHSAGSLEES